MEKLNPRIWAELLKKADVEMKKTDGHQYLTILKTRCQLCGRSPKQKGKCRGWFQTFLDKLYIEIKEL